MLKPPKKLRRVETWVVRRMLTDYVSRCNFFVIKNGWAWSEGIWKENMAYKSAGQQKIAGDPLSNMTPRIVCLRHVLPNQEMTGVR